MTPRREVTATVEAGTGAAVRTEGREIETAAVVEVATVVVVVVASASVTEAALLARSHSWLWMVGCSEKPAASKEATKSSQQAGAFW